MELEIKESEPKKYIVEINDKFIIESSHEVVIPPIYNGDKVWIENDDFKPREPTEYEKELLKGTKTVSELLEEEKKEAEIPKPELTEEEKLNLKKQEIITKVKVIALDELDKHPLTNPSYFSIRDKRKLIEKMEQILKLTEEEITEKFNRVCNEVLFTPEANIENYTIYSKK